MKKIFSILPLLCLLSFGNAQENLGTLSGGYVFTNLKDVDANARGWRINGLYEFNPNYGLMSQGFSFGYIHTSAKYTSQLQTTDFNYNTWPIYYAPKVTFGEKAVKGFVKGALGMHITGVKRTGAMGDFNDVSFGFYGGASAGIMVMLSETIFINAEYEWAYMSNTYYLDGFVNSIMGGIGMRF